jgi:hypothetical protein
MMTPRRSTTPPAPAAGSTDEAVRFAEAFSHACAGAIGETVAGVILHGSLTLGDYLPGRSDVDLLVVVDHPLTDAQLDALTGVAAAHRAQAPDRVDLRVVTSQVATAPTPAQLIGEVPADWVVAVGDAQLADWQAIGDDPGHAELTVLTTCRIWRFVEERRHCSKPAAGAWALARDPTLQVVRDALEQRRGDPAGTIDPEQVARLLAAVRARLAEARDGP